MIKKGYFHKLGNGPINYDWNRRFFIFEKEQQKLTYFYVEEEKTPRGVIILQNMYISSIAPYRDKSFTFLVTVSVPKYVNYIFGFDNIEECQAWHTAINEIIPSIASIPSTRKSLHFDNKEELKQDILSERLSQFSQKSKKSPDNEKLNSPDLVLVDEVNQKVIGGREKWETIKFKDSIKFSGVLNDNARIALNKCQLKSKLIKALIYIIVIILSNFFLKRIIWLLAVSFLYYKLVPHLFTFVSINPKYKMLKAATVIDSDVTPIIEILLKDENKNYSSITLSSTKQSEDASNITIMETVNMKTMLGKLKEYTLIYNINASQNNGTYYLSRKATPDYKDKAFDNKFDNFEEYYVLSQIEDKCIAYFVTTIPDLERLNELNGLKYFVYKKALIRQERKELKKSKKINSTLFATPYKEPKPGEPTAIRKSSNSDKISRRRCIEERFPMYHRYKSGGVWCNNKEELKTQDGIILELIKQAGKQLFDGQGIIGLSLPVKMFEPRSTLERMIDWWATAPVFLPKAAKAADPLEKIKYVIAFSISGLHGGIMQLKPFNPIIGETYQATLHEDTTIYMEHTSHHPPVSHFYVTNPLFTYCGYYEYTFKMTDLGNSVVGNQKGPNILRFNDGSTITYNLPVMKLSGMLLGKRIIQWSGTMTYSFPAHNISAVLTFCKDDSLPTDYFSGSILKNSKEVCKISGSWIESIKFDDVKYWDFEICEYYKPVGAPLPLPSDVIYREDMKAFRAKDMGLAQSEKVRLEILQRADRTKRLAWIAQQKELLKSK